MLTPHDARLEGLTRGSNDVLNFRLRLTCSGSHAQTNFELLTEVSLQLPSLPRNGHPIPNDST